MASTTTEDKLRAEALMPGIADLRRRRGTEHVTFDEVADHFVDFAAASPADRVIADRLAAFLAEVECVPHDHDVPAGSAGT